MESRKSETSFIASLFRIRVAGISLHDKCLEFRIFICLSLYTRAECELNFCKGSSTQIGVKFIRFKIVEFMLLCSLERKWGIKE